MSTRGERIREALAARGVRKQQALAAELAVHESAITRWKEDKEMSLRNAVALCAALDVSLDWLLLGRGVMDSHKARTAADVEFGRIARLAGARSLSLLAAAIESIATDAAGR